MYLLGLEGVLHDQQVSGYMICMGLEELLMALEHRGGVDLVVGLDFSNLQKMVWC